MSAIEMRYAARRGGKEEFAPGRAAAAAKIAVFLCATDATHAVSKEINVYSSWIWERVEDWVLGGKLELRAPSKTHKIRDNWHLERW